MNKVMLFYQDVMMELKKVVFPTRKEVVGSTWVVIVSVLIAAFFLGIVDLTLGKIMSMVFSQR